VGSPVAERIAALRTLGNAIALQSAVEELLSLSGQGNAAALMEVLYPTKTGKLSQVEREVIEENLLLNMARASACRKIADKWLTPLASSEERLLVTDFCRLAVSSERVSSQLLPHVSETPIALHREREAAFAAFEEGIKKQAREDFHAT